jgi:hypothetical protein
MNNMDEIFKSETLLKQKIKIVFSDHSGEAVEPLHMDK